MQVFGLTSLALEWPDVLAPAVVAFLATGTLADHPQLWPGYGRITAGHLAVLAERAAAGPFELTLFDGAIDAGWSWSQRDEAMAARILASGGIGTLAVAGNAHTPVSHTELGAPMGAYLAQRRPGVQEIRINYCSGYFYNFQPVRFAPTGPHRRRIRLYEHNDALLLDLPSASEAVVSRRSQPCPPGHNAP